MVESDKELVKKCVDGSPQAWSEFVDRYSGLVFWAIRRKLARYNCHYLQNDAEDVFQRLFASILEGNSLRRVMDRDDISPWLVVLASNAAMDYMRRRRAEQNVTRLAAQAYIQDIPALQDDECQLLEKALCRLSGKERAFLEYYYVRGKKQQDIADAFNTSVNTVSTVISRARKKIKNYFDSKNI